MENVQNWSSGCKAMPSSFTTKAYTQLGSVPRAAETTINNVAVFQSYRAKQGGPSDELKWRPMRKGVADFDSRAEVSQRGNDRLMNALASVDDSRRLEELIADLQQHASRTPSTLREKRDERWLRSSAASSLESQRRTE